MANEQLSIPERAALVALMTFVEEASNSDLDARYGFTIDKKVRKRLEELRYITASQTGPRRSYVHELTEDGWRRCRTELAEGTPKRAPKGYRLLYGVLRSIDIYMTKSGLKMADVFLLPGGHHSVAGPPEALDVEEQIRAGYESLAARPGAWVSLTRLRASLAGLPRQVVDETLLRLDLQPDVYLIAEANQKVLTDADRAAAIRIGGENKHLLSIETR
jgi:hypothetical protein